MSFQDHFSSVAADYAAYRPTYPPALVAYLAGLPERRELALDCGCGSGQFSVQLADAFERVIATDASAQQIAHAKPHSRVEYRQAPAEHVPLANSSVDLITAAQAAHWFNLEAFYAEVTRVLRADGALALITYGAAESAGPVGARLAHFYRETIAPYWPPARQHIETGYRTLPFTLREQPAPQLSLRAHWTLAQLLGYVRTWSAVRRAIATLGHDPVVQLRGELAAVWGDPVAPREIHWPLRMRVGRTG